jgi:predicted phosphoribosyltransferase
MGFPTINAPARFLFPAAGQRSVAPISPFTDFDTEPFADRRAAGQKLGAGLSAFRGQADVIVVGIPKGGVIVAAEISRFLRVPLSVWISQKLRAPDDQNMGLGSLAEDGEMIVNEERLQRLRIPHTYLVEEVRERRREVARCARLYRQGVPTIEVTRKRIILVDDGLNTGQTVLAALRGLKRLKPASIIVAVPVAPSSAARDVAGEASGLRILAEPFGFREVGQNYVQFGAVSDAEVLDTLAAA